MACATKLYAVGESLGAWQGSGFGTIVKFVDEHTYAIIREIWAVYAREKVSKESASRMKECVGNFREHLITEGKQTMVCTAGLQALPCQLLAMSNMQLHSDIFHAYAGTGRSPHCSYPFKSSSTTPNPMMFRGVDQHADLHYGLDPTLGFHLAAAYAQLKDGPLYSKSALEGSGKVDERRIQELCIRQFSGWCNALKRAMKKKMIMIYNFAGDLFDLSHAIIHTQNNGYGRSKVFGSLRGGSIQVLPGVPLEYDVIDTSNVSDHVGLLNLLLACRELLSKGAHSTLYTLFLHQPSGNVDNRDIMLAEMLRTDLPTFAAMTGLTLLDTSSNVSPNFSNWSQFNVNSKLSGNKRVSVTLDWTYVRLSAVRVNLEHKDFVDIFTEIYREMFEFGLSLPDMSKLKEYMEKLKTQVSHYAGPSMQTFVQLVQIAVKNLHCVESSTIKDLLETIMRLPYQLQHNQSPCLLTWFAAFGLILPAEANAMLRPSQGDLSLFGSSSSSSCSCSPPEIVLLTVLIPKCAVVGKLDKMMTPLIEMSVQANERDDRFSSLQVQYISERRLDKSSKEENDDSTAMEYSNFTLIEGDDSNYKFLACSTKVLRNCLLGENVKVSISLPTSSYRASNEAHDIVGPTGAVYSASLADKHTHTLPKCST